VQLSFASYNIRKAIGLDRRRDPDRILAVLHEIDADVVALQEADRRFGRRVSALPLDEIRERTSYDPVPLTMRPDSIGWHGNALLIKRGIELVWANPVPLPALEPRGAICAELARDGQTFRVVGMHLDLSGLRRRHQIRSILSHLRGSGERCPAVLMGDLNEWARRGGCFREFGSEWQVLAPGLSFPTRRPVASLDRIVPSADWRVVEAGIHHSALAAKASDHLPVKATLQLPNF
jgi:endonuclease/exonuclease/phosphatase family metal-dependent hydrolase